jgi:conjugal transfer pilus assembly protein TraB
MGAPLFWTDMEPGKKKNFILFVLITLFVVVAYCGYYASGRGTKKEVVETKKPTKPINLEETTLEKGLYLQTEMKLQNQKEQMERELEAMRDELAAFKKDASTKKAPTIIIKEEKNAQKADLTSAPETGLIAKKTETLPVKPPLPPPAPKKNLFTGNAPPPPPVKQQDIIIGGIEVISTPREVSNTTANEKKNSIYLPPSFMKATLLSGVAAPTTTGGKINPVPMLFKIDNLAILPNEVRADLKGCFVVAEGTGNLATERVQTRLLCLSCVTQNGEAIIDQDIKGFVVDADGQVDLKGNPVAKMGMHLARVGLAGLLGGLAEGIEQSAYVNSYSPATGITSSALEDDAAGIAKLSIGRGLSQSAKELQKFYIDLAQQTMPVLEVGPTKKVNLVISKGVNIEINKQTETGH